MPETKQPEAKINEFVMLEVESLEPNGFNPNTMSDAKFSQLVKKIRDTGFDEPIQVVKREDKYVIVGGEHRYGAAKLLGLIQVPCVIYDLSDREMMAECVRRNMLRGDLDHAKFGGLLADYLQGAGSVDWAKVAEGFSVSEKDVLKALDQNDDLKELAKAIKPADKPPEGAKKEKSSDKPQAVSVEGDIWELGENGHLLACGNPCKESGLESLIGDNRASLVVIDWPYKKGSRDEEVDIAGSILAFSSYALNPAGWYVWCGHDGYKETEEALTAAGIEPHQQIIWKRSTPASSRLHYPVGHEVCIYGFKEEPPRRLEGVVAGLTSFWECEYDYVSGGGRKDRLGKPVKLYETPMLAHTEPKALCLCAYSASGPMIVAGERVGRKVAAIDPDPVSVDLAISRWQQYTKTKAKCLTRPDVSIALEEQEEVDK